MKRTKAGTLGFTILGTLMAAAVVFICLSQRQAPPRMLLRTRSASQCAEQMLTKVCAGDYTGAAAYLYGNPRLGDQQPRSDQVTQQIWDAFIGSLRFELVGEVYATVSGVAQDVRIESLDIPSVTGGLKVLAPEMLVERAENAGDMSEIYTDSHEYRDDFTAVLLHDAAAQAIAAGEERRQELPLNLIYSEGQWWVMPDQALLNAISGGILE